MVLVLLILLNLLVPQTIESEAFIEVTRFVVPPIVRTGEQAWLVCTYKLSEGDTLHAMKLFKDNKEFYRYTPIGRKEDRKMAFGVPGAMVNVARSNDRQVLLQNVQKASAGVYRCQVSVEGTFRSVSVEKAMNVVDNNDSNINSTISNNNNSNNNNRASNQQNRHNFQQLNRGSISRGGNNNFIPSMLEPITQGQHQASSSSKSDISTTLQQSFFFMISWFGAIQLVILYNILNWTHV